MHIYDTVMIILAENELDLNNSNWLATSRTNLNISRMNPSILIKVDKEIANDVLKLFMAEQL